jgi:hypothetical protein
MPAWILVAVSGGRLVADGWQWRPTLELMRAASIAGDILDWMPGESEVCRVNATTADFIARAVHRKLTQMKPGQRMLADLSVFDCSYVAGSLSDGRDSASYTWLLRFGSFCRRSGGFEIRGSRLESETTGWLV